MRLTLEKAMDDERERLGMPRRDTQKISKYETCILIARLSKDLSESVHEWSKAAVREQVLRLKELADIL